MTTLDYGVTGAKRLVSKSADPVAILTRLMEKNPDADIEQLRALFTAAIEARARRDELREAIDLYFVENTYRRFTTPHARRSPAQIAKEAEQAKAQVDKLLGRVLLLELMIPVGTDEKKPLRLCTREELAAHFGWGNKVVGLLKPGQTPEQANITEAQLWTLNKTARR
jgi:hypothetical protein